jgi:predicted amidohydrolase
VHAFLRRSLRPQRIACVLAALIVTGPVSGNEPVGDSANLVPNPEFSPGPDGSPAGWSRWSSRPDDAPRSHAVSIPAGQALAMEAAHSGQYGKWIAYVEGIDAGDYYTFEVSYQCTAVKSADVSAPVILTWFGDGNDGRVELQRDYVDPAGKSASWMQRRRTLQAPDEARSVRIELGLRWTDAGSVMWRGPRLIRTAPPTPRRVRLATTYLQPRWPATVESNSRRMADLLDQVGAERPDLVLLSENFVDRGVGRPLAETAQSIPGPFTRMLSEKAKAFGTYVVATLNEVDEDQFHVTAVLIDRQGQIAGTYRKVHIPLTEAEAGIVPGNEYPVFETDFGKIGIMICWDHWFPEPARALRLKGAEILLVPLAGDGVPGHWDVVSRARAIDNGIFLVASSTVSDSTSCIIEPTGTVLGETRTSPSYVLREVDLNQEWRVHWLSAESMGEGKSLYVNERRPDTYSTIDVDRSVP